jgi:hypothetical protein
MSPDPDETAPSTEGLRPFREVVPARAVLTELARGFLLVQGSNPERARQFAATFVRECAGSAAAGRPDAVRPVRVAARRRTPVDTGPVEPSNFPPRR